MARPVGQSSAGSTGNRQKIILGVLVVVLIGVLVFELPKVFKGGGSSSGSSPSTSVATSNTSATPVAAGATGTAGTVGVAPTPASVVRAERVIKRLPARDPFVPLATATSGPSAAAAAAAAATPRPTPVAKPAPAKPAALPSGKQLAPTAAVIWTNGRRQVVGIKQSFLVGDQSFKLLSVTSKAAKVAPAAGVFKGAAKQITVVRGKPVTLKRSATGVKYTLNYTLPMTVVGNGG
jgi:hypothetical protein